MKRITDNARQKPPGLDKNDKQNDKQDGLNSYGGKNLSTVTKRLYEALFLVDSASNWDEATERIKSLLAKYDGEVTSIRKWDERKLAYEVKGKNRGLYILVYFNCETGKIREIERDIQLSEDIMRAMILRTDPMSQEDMDRETPAMIGEREANEGFQKRSALEEESSGSDEADSSAEETPEESEGETGTED